MELSVGDEVVVPALGVGKVETHGPIEIGEETVSAYKIDLGPEDGYYWIPESRLGEKGLRPPMNKKDVKAFWKVLTSQKVPGKRANWNRRRKRYDAMLTSNDPTQMARLLGELVAVQSKKRKKKQTLSFGERRLLEKASALIAGEIAATTGDDLDEVLADLTKRLDK